MTDVNNMLDFSPIQSAIQAQQDFNTSWLTPEDYSYIDMNQQSGLTDWINVLNNPAMNTSFFQDYIDYANSGITPDPIDYNVWKSTRGTDPLLHPEWQSSMADVDPLIMSIRDMFDDYNSWDYDAGTRTLYSNVKGYGMWDNPTYDPSQPTVLKSLQQLYDPSWTYIDQDPFLDLAKFVVNSSAGASPTAPDYNWLLDMEQQYADQWSGMQGDYVYTPEGGFNLDALDEGTLRYLQYQANGGNRNKWDKRSRYSTSGDENSLEAQLNKINSQLGLNPWDKNYNTPELTDEERASLEAQAADLQTQIQAEKDAALQTKLQELLAPALEYFGDVPMYYNKRDWDDIMRDRAKELRNSFPTWGRQGDEDKDRKKRPKSIDYEFDDFAFTPGLAPDFGSIAQAIYDQLPAEQQYTPTYTQEEKDAAKAQMQSQLDAMGEFDISAYNTQRNDLQSQINAIKFGTDYGPAALAAAREKDGMLALHAGNAASASENWGGYHEEMLLKEQREKLAPLEAQMAELQQQYSDYYDAQRAIRNEYNSVYNLDPWEDEAWRDANPELATQMDDLFKADKMAERLLEGKLPKEDKYWLDDVMTSGDYMAIPTYGYEKMLNMLEDVPSELAGLTLKEIANYGLSSGNARDQGYEDPATGNIGFYQPKTTYGYKGEWLDPNKIGEGGFGISTEDSQYSPELLNMIFGIPAGWTPEAMTADELGAIGSSPLFDTFQTLYGGQVREDQVASKMGYDTGAEQYMKEVNADGERLTPGEMTTSLYSREALEGDPNGAEGLFMPYWQENSEYTMNEIKRVQDLINKELTGGGTFIYNAFDDAQFPEQYASLMKEHGVEADVGGQKGWILPGGMDQLTEILQQTTGTDPFSQSKMTSSNQEQIELPDFGSMDDSGPLGGLGSVLGIAGAMLGGPIGMAMKIGSSLMSGNPIGAIMGGLDYFNINPLGDITGAINDALGDISLPSFGDFDLGGIDFGSMLKDGAIGALGGQDFFTSALMSGADDLFGSMVGGMDLDLGETKMLNTLLGFGKQIYGDQQYDAMYEDYMDQLFGSLGSGNTQQTQQTTGENTTQSGGNDAIIDQVMATNAERARNAVKKAAAAGMPVTPENIARVMAMRGADTAEEAKQIYLGVISKFQQMAGGTQNG